MIDELLNIYPSTRTSNTNNSLNSFKTAKMSTKSCKSTSTPRVTWSDASKGTFIRICLQVQSRNSSPDNIGFRTAEWTIISNMMEEQLHLGLSKQQLQNQLADLKQKYTVFRNLRENSGFGWDDEKQIVTAADSVWDSYLAVHEQAKPYRLISFSLTHKTSLSISLLICPSLTTGTRVFYTMTICMTCSQGEQLLEPTPEPQLLLL